MFVYENVGCFSVCLKTRSDFLSLVLGVKPNITVSRVLPKFCLCLCAGGKTWDDIIPEADRKRMEEEALQQQLMELNLPPRQRKKVICSNIRLDFHQYPLNFHSH